MPLARPFRRHIHLSKAAIRGTQSQLSTRQQRRTARWSEPLDYRPAGQRNQMDAIRRGGDMSARSRSGCPSLHRIVDAVDGGLCRIKLPGGELLAAQAAAIADCARRHGSGVIEFTNRANLQLRGIRRTDEDALIDALTAAGLGPLRTQGTDAGTVDPTATSARDDRRNVMISPTAGIDPQALLDTRPLADELLRAMQLEPGFDALSPKFAILIDGGEGLAELDHPHDIWLAALPAASGARFAVGLAGTPPSHRDDGSLVGVVEEAHAAATVIALTHAFLELRQAEIGRMRELVAHTGADAIVEHAQARARIASASQADLGNWRRRGVDSASRLGAHPQRDGAYCYVGFQPPLGRIDADRLDRLAELSREAGCSRLRLTPWQGALLPDVEPGRVAMTLSRLRDLDLICDAQQPLARLIACAGSTGCARSPVDTKADAMVLAAGVLPPGMVHVSGCPRSCAAPTAAAYTLLAVAPHLYDLYRRDDRPGLGQCIAHRLSIQEAAVVLRAVGQETVDA
ncbi:precorrin-3B synthase [Lysobacter korlensis]|uniref:Precorrin-3B synthase n=1 Tax=Lysobacter korlensis TaxID=553636 RepID=A0ABV6RS16_9GAMM